MSFSLRQVHLQSPTINLESIQTSSRYTQAPTIELAGSTMLRCTLLLIAHNPACCTRSVAKFLRCGLPSTDLLVYEYLSSSWKQQCYSKHRLWSRIACVGAPYSSTFFGGCHSKKGLTKSGQLGPGDCVSFQSINGGSCFSAE